MRKITYYVAISIDGFISGPDDDISGFVQEGDGVDQYRRDLAEFDTVIMGRKTYEFGYKYGLQPGQPGYPHMKHYLFSKSLKFDHPSDQVMVCPLDVNIIKELQQQEGTDIYLCGGGEFAGWLLENELIDVLKVKLNPLILGQGVPLFGASTKSFKLTLMESEQFEGGLQIMTYQIEY
ncbi:MAG: dihydrofolate reductase [Saprospiraceae bacterium]|nr:MAG: dihydrofolate reductase [Saprospiraceae bacterium]